MKQCGILLHLSSLPSPYGIGTMGRAAYAFVDLLAHAKNRYWQMLPIGPTGYADSPYQSFSAFAGNPYFIDLDMLDQEGLLGDKSYQYIGCGAPDRVNYGMLYETRLNLLWAAYRNRHKANLSEYEFFVEKNAGWIHDYALFTALHNHFNAPWYYWEDDIKFRREEAMKRYAIELRYDIEFHIFLQFLFARQFAALKKYANQNNVRLIGDLPFYVAYDSADVWAHPELFDLDESLQMQAVAGVPPDAFSPDGQRWGNPLYNWVRMEENGFAWWLARIEAAWRQFDGIRLDHFRGFESFYAVPAGEQTAKNGTWIKAPGRSLFRLLREKMPDIHIIAEDLGEITPAVTALLEETGFPGTRVLQFAFDGNYDNPHLPENCGTNCVLYTGTHDNMTSAGWYKSLCLTDKLRVRGRTGLFAPAADSMIRYAFSSPADTVIIPMQDYLRLDNRARMNVPAQTSGDNWCWRLLPQQIEDARLAGRIRELADRYHRSSDITYEQMTF